MIYVQFLCWNLQHTYVSIRHKVRLCYKFLEGNKGRLGGTRLSQQWAEAVFVQWPHISPRPNSRQDYWSWRNESGGWFQRRGDAYLNERCVIFKEMVGGQVRVAADEERVLRGDWTCAAPSVDSTAAAVPLLSEILPVFPIIKCIGDDTKSPLAQNALEKQKVRCVGHGHQSHCRNSPIKMRRDAKFHSNQAIGNAVMAGQKNDF